MPVKYSSRVNASGGASVPRAGRPKKKTVTAETSTIPLGGIMKEHEKKQIKKEIIAMSSKKDNISSNKGAGLSTGGDISVGGRIDIPKLQNMIANLTHTGMGSVLSNMDNISHDMLQGIAGSSLQGFNSHPLTEVIKKTFGGSFTHPRNISKMATRDICRAISPQQLAQALHMEHLDKRKGINVGGGLLSALRHHFQRGVEHLQSKIPVARRIGEKLHKALTTGIQVGQTISPIVEAIFPGSGALISTGITAAEALKRGISVGLEAGEKIEKVLSVVSPEKKVEIEEKISELVIEEPTVTPEAPDRPTAGEVRAVKPLEGTPRGSGIPGLSLADLRAVGLA